MRILRKTTKQLAFNFFLIALMAGCSLFSKDEKPKVEEFQIRPVLVGDYLPEAFVFDKDSNKISLRNIVKGKNTVMVFFRGGWCPYCNKQLQGLRTAIKELREFNVQVVAISPDNKKGTWASYKRHNPEYFLFSDSSMEAADAMGISFKVADLTYKKLMRMGVNLEEISGFQHRKLPVPSIFFIRKI